jgi:phospholipase C
VIRHRLGTVATVAACVALDACAGGAASALPRSGLAPAASGTSHSPIEHVVVMVQENRTFNDFFATFPGVVGTTTGKMRVAGKTEIVKLSKVPLESPTTLRHTYPAYHTAYRDGHMDAFNLIRYQTNGKPEGKAPYQYVDPKQIAPYWTMAKDYALADHMFQTQGSGSFTAHQDLIAGGTQIDATHSIVDDPTKRPWGCPAPAGAVTSLITTGLRYQRNAGPFPCLSYATLADLLDAKGVSWKYYTPAWRGNTGAIWNAFLAIDAVFNKSGEWNEHVSQPETTIFTDISARKLPAMSWLIPDGINSDHPAYASDTGPSWVASVVNAVGESSYWKSTAIIIVWDDWGGFYDPLEPPPLDRQGGPGFRVPAIVISPYVPRNEISHSVYEFGSILRFVEDTWGLGRLGTTDSTSKSMTDLFNFKRAPRKFRKISSQYSRSYFIHQPPSGLPVDTE